MWTSSDIPDLTGRTAVVTGATAGLGWETAAALAGAGAHVVLAARNRDKADVAADSIRRRHPTASLEFVRLDLGDLSSVATAAATINAHRVVDVLVNNAGVMATPRQRTVDGFEWQLGVDHLGHFALTAHLLPALLRADAARVVTVSSLARFVGRRIDPSDPHLRHGYGAWKCYGRAKLANLHFGLGLHRRFACAGVAARSLVAHPGAAYTDIMDTTVEAGGAGWGGHVVRAVGHTLGRPPAEGARPQLRAATDPNARSGELYAPRFGSFGPAVRRPVLPFGVRRSVEVLWAVSERETGLTLDVAATRDALHE